MAETIRVGPLTYALIRDPALSDDDAMGAWNAHRLEIRLAEGLPPEREQIEAWHEVIHAILFAAGIEAAEHDEQLVRALAHGIVAALKDNSGSVLHGS